MHFIEWEAGRRGGLPGSGSTKEGGSHGQCACPGLRLTEEERRIRFDYYVGFHRKLSLNF